MLGDASYDTERDKFVIRSDDPTYMHDLLVVSETSRTAVHCCRGLLGCGSAQYLTAGTADRAADQWASGATYNLMCLSQQHWRPAALLAIVKARQESESKGAQPLKIFLRELECLSIYMVAKKFKQARILTVYNQLISNMKVCYLSLCSSISTALKCDLMCATGFPKFQELNVP